MRIRKDRLRPDCERPFSTGRESVLLVTWSHASFGKGMKESCYLVWVLVVIARAGW